jgi:hypothetical protein
MLIVKKNVYLVYLLHVCHLKARVILAKNDAFLGGGGTGMFGKTLSSSELAAT